MYFCQAVITVNLTSMLVLTTMFINVSNNLPKTSYMKMMDVWLLFNLLYPFVVVLMHTYMDTLRKDDENEKPIEDDECGKGIEMVIQYAPKRLKSYFNILCRYCLCQKSSYL